MRSTYLAAACVSLFACTVEAPDSSVTNQAATVKNRLASNRLASNRLASNRLASNRLASNYLDSTSLSAWPDTSDILSTSDGRDVYSYIVSCALPEGTTISADVAGAHDSSPTSDPPYDTNYTCVNGHCTFNGAIGLAPHWVNHKLDNKGAGWVSACVLSRCNANGIAESISMRGRANALLVGGEELVDYSAEEGAFFGNIFDAGDTTQSDAEWLFGHANACTGANNDVAHAQARDCATDTSYCGFNVVGDCRNFDSFANPVACGGYTGTDGYYTDCHDVLSNNNGRWKPHDAPFREVITTYVSN